MNGYEINDDGILIEPVIESEMEIETEKVETEETKESVIQKKSQETIVEIESDIESKESISRDEVVADEIVISTNSIFIIVIRSVYKELHADRETGC